MERSLVCVPAKKKEKAVMGNLINRVAVPLACALLAHATALAQTTWTGASSANWADPGNWTAGVPAAG